MIGIVLFVLSLAGVVGAVVRGYFVEKETRMSETSDKNALAQTNDINCKRAGNKCVGTSAEVIQGERGSAGPAGRGIVSTRFSGCTLSVLYTNGTADTFPDMCGKPGSTGVGIASVTPGRCSLAVRLTNGRSVVLANLCGLPGQRGLQGEVGPSGTPGIPGVDGAPGDKGDTGVGIASISDVRQEGEVCTITFAMTDGTSVDRSWRCSPSPSPSQTPSSAPTAQPNSLGRLPGG